MLREFQEISSTCQHFRKLRQNRSRGRKEMVDTEIRVKGLIRFAFQLSS